MDSKVQLEYEWPYILSFFPPEKDLERTAKEYGAISRKRGISSASTLLRLAMAYGFCGLTLRQTAAWAKVAGITDISDVALMKRLRKASDWLGYILGLKLAEKAPPPPVSEKQKRIRLVDASSISHPGSKGTDWRIHLEFDLSSLSIENVEVTDSSGGESLTRFSFQPGEIVIGDRGYAHRRGLNSVQKSGADFIVRLNWQNVPLQHESGEAFDLLEFLRRLPDAHPGEINLWVTPSPREAIPGLKSRFVAIRKSEAAAEESRRKVLEERSRKGRSIDPRSLESAGYIFVLTSLDQASLAADRVLDLYRFRWQIELAFKRLKSLLHLDDLQARDPPLARSFLYAKLLAALLLEELTNEFLSFSPWGYRLERTSSIPLANTDGTA